MFLVHIWMVDTLQTQGLKNFKSELQPSFQVYAVKGRFENYNYCLQNKQTNTSQRNTQPNPN